MTRTVSAAFKKLFPKDELVFHGTNVGYTYDAVMIAADAFKRARSTEPKALGGAIKFNPKGQVEGNLSAAIQNLKGRPTVTLPTAFAEAKVVFPSPDYKKT